MSTIRIYITVDQPGFYNAVEHASHQCDACEANLIEYSMVRRMEGRLTCTSCLIDQQVLAACVGCGKLREPSLLREQRCVMCKLQVQYVNIAPLIVLT